MTDHYATLNVSRHAEDVVIESAHKALMKRYHPDKTAGDPVAAERAKSINAAFDILRNPVSRAAYDRTLGREKQHDRSGMGTQEASQPPLRQATPAYPAGTRASQTSRDKTRGVWSSVVFIGASILIGVGAVGSLMGVNAGVSPVEQKPADTAAEPASPEPGHAATPRGENTRASKAEAAATVATDDAGPAGGVCQSEIGAVASLVCSDPEVARAKARLDLAVEAQAAKASDPNAVRASNRIWLSRQDGLAPDRQRLVSALDARTRELELNSLDGLY